MKLAFKSDKSEHNELIAGCIKGQRRHQKKLYELYHGKMMAVCLRYTNNYEEARDVLTEGFMKVYNNLHRYKPSHSLDSWMKRIMINTAIDHYRKNKKHSQQVDIEYASNESGPNDGNPISSLSAQEILLLVQNLPPAYRTVFNLYAIEGYNHREIGELLGISEGTSKSNLAKARGKLKKMIAAKHEDPYYT